MPSPLEALFVSYRTTGRPEPLGELFDRASPQLLAVALHLCPHPADAEDALQATFVAAIDGAGGWDSTRPVLPWLLGILTKQCRRIGERRARRREQELPDEPLVLDDGSPLAASERRELVARLREHIDRLPVEQRQVLLLQLEHGLAPAEVAEVVGVPAGTVRMRLHRGVQALRAVLPATLVALLLAALPSRGLAAVRDAVVGHAGAAVLGGAFAMKKVALVAVVFVMLGLGVAMLRLSWWSEGSRDAAPAELQVVTAAQAREREAPAQEPQRIAVEPGQQGLVFTGRCIAADTGAPLAGVRAVAYRDSMPRDLCDNELGTDTPAGLATSGGDGCFRIECARVPDATYALRVGNQEHVHRVRSFGPYAQDRVVELGDVALARGVHVSLAVVDRRGSPVAGVRLTASATHMHGRNDMLMLDTGYPWRSDAQGEIRLPYSMPPGHYDVGWVSDSLPQDRAGTAVEVPAGSPQYRAVLVWPVEDVAYAVLGQVVDESGHPVSELSLGAEGGGTRGNARTLGDGTFRMPRIGPYDANARGPVEFGLPNATCGLELVGKPTCEWGDRGVRLVVRPVATLHVRAIDATTGGAVQDFDVACAAHLVDGGAPAIVWQRYSPLERLPDGSVRRRLARCLHDVQVFPKDSRLAPSFKVVWDPGRGEDLVVPLVPLRACTVRVVTTEGEPVAGTELWTLQPIEAVAGAPMTPGWQEVAVLIADEQQLDPTTRWARHGIDDAPLGTARTGADGRAQVLVPADTDVVIAALGPGHVPKAVVGRVTDHTEVEFLVTPGTSVRVVLTPKDVVQRALSSRQQRMLAAGVNDQGTGGLAVQLLRVSSEQDPARPEAGIVIPIAPDGTCEHRGLRPGRYDLALGGFIESGSMDGMNVFSQFGPVSVRDGEANEIPIDVSRWAIGRLQGQVLLNGQPWAFGTGDLWSMRWPEYRSIVPVTTDADGRFDVEAVVGEYQLHLLGLPNSELRCCAVEAVRVAAGVTSQLVLTARNVTARVRVVGANGEPATDLTVTTDYVTQPNNHFSWTTDADGWITLHPAPPVPFHLIVTNPDGPVRAGRRSSSSGDAKLGPFEVPPTGDRAEFCVVLPEGWR